MIAILGAKVVVVIHRVPQHFVEHSVGDLLRRCQIGEINGIADLDLPLLDQQAGDFCL